MSPFKQLASLARSKLNSSLASGSRDNLSLHRWVLLKNSITREEFSPNSSLYSTVNDSTDVDSFEDDDVDAVVDPEEDSYFAFLFPDPGYASSPNASELDSAKEEQQWFDSLYEELNSNEDDYDADSSNNSSNISFSNSEPSSPTLSLNEDLDTSSSPDFVPYTVPYSLSNPPLLLPGDIDTHHEGYQSPQQSSLSICSPYHDIDDPFFSVLPDTIEDTSDDETDSLATPFSRSRSSLNLSLDVQTSEAAAIPLPADNCDNDSKFRSYSKHAEHTVIKSRGEVPRPLSSYEVDPLPYPDMDSCSPVIAPIYGSYHFY